MQSCTLRNETGKFLYYFDLLYRFEIGYRKATHSNRFYQISSLF